MLVLDIKAGEESRGMISRYFGVVKLFLSGDYARLVAVHDCHCIAGKGIPTDVSRGDLLDHTVSADIEHEKERGRSTVNTVVTLGYRTTLLSTKHLLVYVHGQIFIALLQSRPSSVFTTWSYVYQLDSVVLYA
jgi:hypothetical protein